MMYEDVCVEYFIGDIWKIYKLILKDMYVVNVNKKSNY